MARNSGDGDSEAFHDLSPSLRRLAEICVEAASKSLVILNELREKEIIGMPLLSAHVHTITIGSVLLTGRSAVK